MELFISVAHWFGAAVCDQLETHSYEIAGVTLPLCARCTGMYLGAIMTMLFHAWRHPRAMGMPRRWVLVTLTIFFLAWAGDGVNSLFSIIPIAPHLYPPSNLLRLITGALMGITLGSFLFIVFNSLVWELPTSEKIFTSKRDLAALLGLSTLLVWIVQSDLDFLLLPLVAISLISILILHFGLMTAFISSFTRRAYEWRQVLVPLAIGAIIAVAYLSVLAEIHALFIPASLG